MGSSNGGKSAFHPGTARYAGLVLALVGCTALIAHSVNHHYPIVQWLFWSYARCWALSSLFVLACAAAGNACLRYWIVDALPWRERVMFALAVGVLIFFLGLFLGGLVGLYGSVFFFALPLIMLAGGIWLDFDALRIRIRRVPPLWKRLKRPLGMVDTAVAVFGLASLGMVYFLVLYPDNIAYDSRWYHLPIAEHYASAGRVARFPEGWYQGSLPHLASFIYTWGFLLPKSKLFDRVELCSHLEFVIFLSTLFSIPVLVRWMAPRARVGLSWVAIFLFSGIFLYDSSLTTAADHIAAFWSVPIFVALRRAWEKLDPRWCALLGAMLAGSALAKYQTMSALVFPICAVIVRAIWLALRARGTRNRAAVLRGPAAAASASLALTAPHWLKNWVWYGDPIYPFLYKHLHLHPWTPDSANLFESYFIGLQLARPSGATTSARLFETAKAMFTFAFEPHNWPETSGTVPVFGFLLTAALLCATFVRPSRRLWAVLVACQIGVFVWYWVSHQDRYLQIILPWMAAAAAALVALCWRAGKASRAAVAALVGLQVIWGGDVYFIPTHSMIGASPIPGAVALMSTGYRKDFTARDSLGGDMGKVAALLPPGSKVLLHEIHHHLGLRAPSVNDEGPWQGGISYGRLPSPRDLYEQMAGYGVTHFLWTPQKSVFHDSLAGDLVFFEFASKYTKARRKVGAFAFARMPTSPPPDRRWLDELVLVLVCPGSYAPGIYRLGDLTVSPYGKHGKYPKPRTPVEKSEVAGSSDRAAFAAIQESCWTLPPSAMKPFATLASRGEQKLMSRRSPLD